MHSSKTMWYSACRKIEFSQKILHGYDEQNTLESHSKKAMLQAYHCREILDWITSRVLGKATKIGDDNEVEQRSIWNIVLTLLQTTHWLISPIIITSLAATIENLSESARNGMDDLFEDFCSILEILCEKSATKEQLGLHLEHGASLLEACLHMYMRNRSNKIVLKMASFSSKLFTLHMDRFIVEKKVWDAIVVRQLDAVMFGAFYDDQRDSMEMGEIRLSVQESSRIILNHAMLMLDTLSDLADSLSKSKQDNKESGQSYTSKLLPILSSNMALAASGKYDCQVVASMFSWLLKSYSERMSNCRHLIPAKFQDAYSLLFFKLAMMVLKIPDISDGFRMRLLAALTKEIKAAGLYRPTGLGGLDQQNSLSDIVSLIFDCGVSSTDSEIVSACLQALDGILVVEHKCIEERLEEYWGLIEVIISNKGHKCVEHSMGLLIREFSKLRRLDCIFTSLGSGLRNQNSHLWQFLLTSEHIKESFKDALNHIPSGQTTRFVDCMKVWAEEMHHSSVVHCASAASLVLENVPVDLNNAGKVSMHAEKVLRLIQSMMQQHMNDSNHDMLSSLLVIQTELLGICMECSKIDPNIAPLHTQGVRPPFWNESMLENEFHGSLDIFSTSKDSDDCISLPITSLAGRAKSLDGQQRARLVYSLTLVIKMHLKVCTEQYQYNVHRVIDEKICKTDGYIAGIMEVLTDLIHIVAATHPRSKGSAGGFHELDLDNIGNAVVECLTSDLEWLQVGFGCLQRGQQFKLVQQLLSLGFIPTLAFGMESIESLLQISCDLLSTIQRRLSPSGKKRKSDGRQPHDISVMFELARLIPESPTCSKQFYKSIDRVMKGIHGDEVVRTLKKHVLGKHQQELMSSYELAGLLSKLCFSNVRVSQMIRDICLDHIYYSIMIISSGVDIESTIGGQQCTSIIDGFSYQARLLHEHASPEDRSHSNRILHVFGLYKIAEASLERNCDIVEKLRLAVSVEVELLCKADDVQAMLEVVKKDTSLVLGQSICKLVQNESLPLGFLDNYYEDIFHQMSKQTKELLKSKEYTATHSEQVSVIADAASDALPILAVNKDSKVRTKLLERMPILFNACIRELVAELSSSQLRDGHVRALCAFVETCTRLLSSIKPRMSWEEYVNVFSAISTVLYVCPRGIGQGHQSRPNAPKEAMIITASSFDSAGEAHRNILCSMVELIRSSTREECSRLLSCMPLNCIPFLEILLIMLEDSENGVLKDLLDNQVDTITYNIVQGIQFPALLGDKKYSASEFLQATRSKLLASSQENRHVHPQSSDSYSIQITLAFRCIESIVCRPLRFKKFPKRWIAMVLSAVESASNFLCRHGDDHYDACFIGISNILVGMMRHQPIYRTLHLMGLAIRSLQNSLFTRLCLSTQKPSPHVIECFCRILEEFAKIRAVQPYCKDVILTHVKLFMSPITENALEDSLPLSLCDMVTSQKSSGYVVISTDVQELIAPGICALYGIFSANDIQDVYASLGRQASWQSALNNLKMVYESQFRYIGKV